MKVIQLFENGYHFPHHLLIFQMEHSFNHYTMIWLLRPIIMLDEFQSVCVSPKRGSQNWMYYLKYDLIMQNASVLELLATLLKVIYRGRKHTQRRGWRPHLILVSWTFIKLKCPSFTDRTLLNQISWVMFLLELMFWVEKISCVSVHTRVYFWRLSSILIICALVVVVFFFFKPDLTIQCVCYCTSFVKRFLSGFWLSDFVLATDDTMNKMIACPWWQCRRCCLQNDWYKKEKESSCVYLEQFSPGQWEIAIWH